MNEEITIGAEGMKIDRDLYRSFQSVVTDDSTIRDFVENMEFENAENYLEENILDKPEEYFTLQKLGKSLELDRKLSVSELLLHAFGHIDRIKSKNECLEEDFEKLEVKTFNNEVKNTIKVDFIEEEILVKPIDYYYTNSIARSSKVMSECRQISKKFLFTGIEKAS